MTPCCQLLAEFEVNKAEEYYIPTLKLRVNLRGAKYPNDIFVINLPARGITEPQERSQTFEDLGVIMRIIITCMQISIAIAQKITMVNHYNTYLCVSCGSTLWFSMWLMTFAIIVMLIGCKIKKFHDLQYAYNLQVHHLPKGVDQNMLLQNHLLVHLLQDWMLN